MGGSGRDPVMEDFAYFHRELTRIQTANAHAPPRRLAVPAAVWRSKEQVRESACAHLYPEDSLSSAYAYASPTLPMPSLCLSGCFEHCALKIGPLSSTVSSVWSSFSLPLPLPRHLSTGSH
jgi:hypothetical protein